MLPYILDANSDESSPFLSKPSSLMMANWAVWPVYWSGPQPVNSPERKLHNAVCTRWTLHSARCTRVQRSSRVQCKVRTVQSWEQRGVETLGAPQCLASLRQARPCCCPSLQYTAPWSLSAAALQHSALHWCIPALKSRGKSRARPQTFSPPSSVAMLRRFKEEQKSFCKIQFCFSSPFTPLFSHFQLINLQKDFYQSTFYFCSYQQMTQQMNPVHWGTDSSRLLYTFPPHLHQIWKVALDKYKIYSGKIALPGFSIYVQGHVFNPQWRAWWT